jgi:hypothetical protein
LYLVVSDISHREEKAIDNRKKDIQIRYPHETFEIKGTQNKDAKHLEERERKVDG